MSTTINPPRTPAVEAEDKRYRELLGAIARQDEAALGDFYDATVARSYGVALRITGKPDAAEEVVVDIYWQVWQQAGRYNPERGPVLGWLLTISRSRALDYLRRRDKTELHPEPDTLRPYQESQEDNPLNLLLAVDRHSQLHAALEQLSPVQRQLISLAFFKGLTHQEIATHTDTPLGTVKTHIRRALGILQPILRTQDDSLGGGQIV